MRMKNYLYVLPLVLVFSNSIRAQVYTYFDERKGTIIYTNVPPNDKGSQKGPRQLGPNNETKASPKVEKQKATEPAVKSQSSSQYDQLIAKYSERHKVDFNLIKAVIKAESNFNPRAVSRKGAKGLMQLMPGTAVRLGVQDIFDPEENIASGVRYLRYLIDLFNQDLKRSLAAYNAGEKVVQRVNGVPPYRETIDYVKKIIAMYGSDLHLYPDNRYAWNYKFYAYRSEDGVLHLTNVDPPQSNIR